MRTRFLTMGLLAAALAIGLAAGHAEADIIDPGLDLLKTQPGSFWDFSAPGQRIDGDHFGPGSDPFEGQVATVTLTRVWRPGGSDFVQNPDVIPTEIVAMELHSAEPVPITFDGGLRTILYDVVVTPDPSGPNAGQLTVLLDPSAPTPGGTIDGDDNPPLPPIPPDSFFDVCFRFEFIPQGPGTIVHATRSDRVVLTEDVPWSSTAPAPYYHPDAGSFFPGIDPFSATPQDPCIPQTMIFQGQAFTWVLRLEPVVPEPATLSLLALGGLGLLRWRRRSGLPAPRLNTRLGA